MKLRKIIGIFSLVVIIGGTIGGVYFYKKIFAPNTKFTQNEVAIYIPTGAGFDQVSKLVAPYVENVDTFEWVADKKKYPENIKAGKIVFKKGMSSSDLITALRNPVPVKLSFNNQETLQDAMERIGDQLEVTPEELTQAFTDKKFLEDNGLTEDNVLSIIIPNTYEFYWNTTATKVRERMVDEYRKFWTPERKAKAEKLGLTPLQVSALASIVHKETVKSDERPRVAGVYLNRLAIGMKLQADPTAIYAKKKTDNDFGQVIKRVLTAYTQIDSPYNTYYYKGVPPGPIAMPDITAIDAVLNPEKHNYLYFCASVTNFGYHEFAVTEAQHKVNAAKYHAWLDKMDIKK